MASAIAGAGAYGLWFNADQPAKTAGAETPATQPTGDAQTSTPAEIAVGLLDSPSSTQPRSETASRDQAAATPDTQTGSVRPDVVTYTALKPTVPPGGTRLTEREEKRRTSEILRADEELREGRLAIAMKLYSASLESHPTILDPVVQFRWALCAEALGMLDEAAERYQMLSDSTLSPAWRGLARWGLSRVLFEQKKIEPALTISNELWLTQEQSAPLWRAELLHWHAHLLYRRVADPQSQSLLDDKSLIGCRIVARPGDLLEIASRIYASESKHSFEQPAAPAVTESAGPSPEGLYAQYKSGGASVHDAISQFANAAKWTVQWSPAAEQLAQSHRIRAQLSRQSVASLLDTLCERPHLIWSWKDNVLTIVEAGERPRAEFLRYQTAVASRSVREAQLFYPGARWLPQSRLAQAHLELLSGLPAAARQSLELLIAQSIPGDLVGEAWFNLAKIRLGESDPGKAIHAFERALDNSPGSTLEPVAQMYLGRLLLEANEPRKAVLPLRRAVALAPVADRGTAVVTLAGAYLSSGQPQQTSEILRTHMALLNNDTHRDVTAFLSCLAQVQGGSDPTRKKYDLRSLMTAVSHVRSQQFFDRSGACLIAQAYQELGLTGEAADICRDAIAQMPDCAMRNKLRLMLVDESVGRRDFDEAEAMLREIADSLNEEVRLDAHSRLCLMLLDRGRRDEAELQAQAWLKQCRTPEQQQNALRMLGRCLEMRGDYLNAALCFSGSIPHGARIESEKTP